MSQRLANQRFHLYNNAIFESKYDVEQYIRTLAIKSSHFVPASFMSNYQRPGTKPQPLGDGTYGFINVYGPGTTIPLIDVAADTGKWVVPMLANPDKYEGKCVSAATKLYSQTEVADIMSKATGKTVKHIQISVEEFRSHLPESMRVIISEMWQANGDFGYYGANQDKEVEWGCQQASGKLTTLEEYFQREPLKLD